LRGGVFINCPFDDAYRPIFDAIVFAILACEYRVRSALEVADGGDLRLNKILRMIGEATHSIHDLSRVELDTESQLPRFNMPIELGIALGQRRYAKKTKPQRILILDSEKFRYRKFASDLAGLDIAEHGNDPLRAIACVRQFFSSDARNLPTPDVIQQLYQSFETVLPAMAQAKRQSVDQLVFIDRLRLAEMFVDQAKAIML
jgi:hypothetical protein